MAACGRTVVRGPSVEEWKRYKRKIIDMYRTRPLKEVMLEMQLKYNFCATKRMYDTRFRAWKIDKNMKGVDKDVLALELAASRNHTESPNRIPISDKTLKKIIRHVHSQSRKESRTSRGHREERAEFASPLPNWKAPTRSDIDKVVDHGVSPSKSDVVTPFLLTPSSMVESEAPEDGSVWTEESPNSLPLLTPSTGRSVPSTLSAFRGSPSITLELSAVSRTKRLALHNVQAFFLSTFDRLESPASGPAFLSIRSTFESKRFWHNIKHGIYLWKINSQFQDRNGHALESFNEANALAAEALSSEPVDFCRELLMTLSPINTSVHPPLRRHILSYLMENSSTILGTQHPITMLCSALLQDDDCLDVSMSGLDLMLDLFGRYLGPSHQASYRIMENLITMMRWTGDLEAARDLADNALCLARFDLGRNSCQTRRAAMELSHILTKLGEYGRTLSLRLESVQKPNIQSRYDFEVQYYQDGLAVHAMEDLAEYYVRFGNVHEGIAWLSRAQCIALEHWGMSIATSHVSDKLDSLISGSTRGQVINEQYIGSC